jgi:hypothetical protein
VRRLLLILLLAVPCLAQAPDYAELLAKAKAQDPALDFGQLRLAFTKTESYNPYQFDEEARDAAMKAINEKDYAKAAQLADKLLTDNYLDLDGHLIALDAARNLKDTGSEKQHEYMLDGLIKAIATSGDGKSPKTAWQVIFVREEYIFCKIAGADVVSQSLVTEDGHNVDALTVRRKGETEKHTLYFNVDIPFTWMGEHLK